MEIAEAENTLGALPVGARLIVRCKRDWRGAVVSKIDREKATLIVSSPTGGSYRLRRALDALVVFDGGFPVLRGDGCEEENWRDGFVKYDARW